MDELEVKIYGLGKEDRKNIGRIFEFFNVWECLVWIVVVKVIYSFSVFFVIIICVFFFDF